MNSLTKEELIAIRDNLVVPENSEDKTTVYNAYHTVLDMIKHFEDFERPMREQCPNEYKNMVGQDSKNRITDITIRKGNTPYHLVNIYSMSAHMWDYPQSRKITQSSTVCNSRTLNDKALMTLKKDLRSMIKKITAAHKYKRFDTAVWDD